MAYSKNRAGTVTNKYGVKISAYKQKELRYYVQRANQKAQIMLSKYSAKRREELEKLKEKRGDFVIQKKSANLQSFKSKEQFDIYLQRVKEISKGVYEFKQAQRYRQNLTQSLKTKFGSDADALIDKINSLSDKKIRDFTLEDKLHDVGWVYNEPVSDNKKFNTIENEINKLSREK